MWREKRGRGGGKGTGQDQSADGAWSVSHSRCLRKQDPDSVRFCGCGCCLLFVPLSLPPPSLSLSLSPYPLPPQPPKLRRRKTGKYSRCPSSVCLAGHESPASCGARDDSVGPLCRPQTLDQGAVNLKLKGTVPLLDSEEAFGKKTQEITRNGREGFGDG